MIILWNEKNQSYLEVLLSLLDFLDKASYTFFWKFNVFETLWNIDLLLTDILLIYDIEAPLSVFTCVPSVLFCYAMKITRWKTMNLSLTNSVNITIWHALTESVRWNCFLDWKSNELIARRLLSHLHH